MTLSLIAVAIIATILGIIAHVIWWHVRRPSDDALALAFIVGVVPLVFSLASTFLFQWAGVCPSISRDYATSLGAIAILHGVFALVYMSCYTAAQAASPTVLIVLSAANATAGVTKLELENRLTDDLVCGDLVTAAMEEKFVDIQNGGLRLGRRGQWLLKVGRLVRKLAGLGSPVG